MKTILGTGDLGTLRNVARASVVCMMAGADFIKTSTGKEGVNATLPISMVMTRMIREYQTRTGHRIGFKPAGGISTAKLATAYLILMKEELGRDWLEPALFRFGASSLLTDIERQLDYHTTGRYAAAYHRFLKEPEQVEHLKRRRTSVEPLFDLVARVLGSPGKQGRVPVQRLGNVRTCLTLGVLTVQLAMIMNNVWGLPLRNISGMATVFS